MTRFDRRPDETDLRLLACLRRNARTPLTVLAREIGLSRAATQDRLRRLERDGVIQGYTVRLRPAADAPFHAWLALMLAAGAVCAEVAPRLLERSGILACYSLAGAIDMLVLVEARSVEELSDLREWIAGLKAVGSVRTFTVLAEHLAPAAVPPRRAEEIPPAD